MNDINNKISKNKSIINNLKQKNNPKNKEVISNLEIQLKKMESFLFELEKDEIKEKEENKEIEKIEIIEKNGIREVHHHHHHYNDNINLDYKDNYEKIFNKNNYEKNFNQKNYPKNYYPNRNISNGERNYLENNKEFYQTRNSDRNFYRGDFDNFDLEEEKRKRELRERYYRDRDAYESRNFYNRGYPPY